MKKRKSLHHSRAPRHKWQQLSVLTVPPHTCDALSLSLFRASLQVPEWQSHVIVSKNAGALKRCVAVCMGQTRQVMGGKEQGQGLLFTHVKYDGILISMAASPRVSASVCTHVCPPHCPPVEAANPHPTLSSPSPPLRLLPNRAHIHIPRFPCAQGCSDCQAAAAAAGHDHGRAVQVR